MQKQQNEYSSAEISQLIAASLADKKGENIKVLNLKKVPNAVSDYFIVCHGNSNSHVDALAGSALIKTKQDMGIMPIHKEGFENSEWILLDYFDVVVHIFQKHARDFYQLESLWADAEVEIIKTEE